MQPPRRKSILEFNKTCFNIHRLSFNLMFCFKRENCDGLDPPYFVVSTVRLFAVNISDKKSKEFYKKKMKKRR